MDYGPPPPPSGRTGMLHSNSAPTIEPMNGLARNLPSLKNVTMTRQVQRSETVPKAVWSDSNAHLNEDEWPAHAVALWVFTGKDRPRPGFREEVRFTLRDERYINFCVRLRCGLGDRYGGGSVGIVHSADRSEADVGSEGQLISITDVCIQPNNTVIITAIGDVPFRVKRAWMPRGLRGLQLAFIEAAGMGSHLASIVRTCSTEPCLTIFGRMLTALPELSDYLDGSGKFTVFAPTNEALYNLGMNEEELLSSPDLEALVLCHVCPNLKAPSEALYNGRTLRAMDGTVLQVNFLRWPKGAPSVNDVPLEHLDVFCTNGVIHTITGLLRPAPAPIARKR